jgi:acrylyl-CoA reductase (NADPH)
VSLLGVDSVMAPAKSRDQAWQRLGADLPTDKLAEISSVRGFSELPDLAEQILAGATQGRIVIDCGR